MQKLELSENTSLKQFEKHILEEMKKVVEFFEKELSKLRTNRANPSLIEATPVSVYGQVMHLKNIAVITVSDTYTLIVQPFDVGTLNDIERALSQQDLGALPRSDGKVIKISLPPMSQSRRQEMVKMVNRKHEEAVVSLRKIRQDILTAVKDTEKAKKVSEDLSQRLQKQLQVNIDQISRELGVLQSNKEASLKD